MSQQLEEKIKSYWDRQPCNIRHSQKPLGSVEYFEEVTARRYRVEPHILDFAQFHRWQGRRVLEIGCGIGTDAEQFVRHLGEFDLVYSYGVIHHSPNIAQHIQEIHSLVAPGGEFRFMVYAKNSWKYAMIQKGLDQFEAQAECPYAEAFTRDEIYQLLDGQFNVERIRQDHCFMYDIPAYRQGRYELEPWFAAMSDTMRDAVKEYLGWHLLIKARKL